MFAKVRFLSLIIGQRGRLVYEKMCSKKSVLELNRPLPVHFLSVTFVFFSKMADIPLDCADSMKQPQTGHLIKHYLWRLSSDELKLSFQSPMRTLASSSNQFPDTGKFGLSNKSVVPGGKSRC